MVFNFLRKDNDGNQRKVSPAIFLKKMAVFPTEKISLVLEGEEISKTVSKAHDHKHQIVLLFQKDSEKSEIGVMARIIQHQSITPALIGLIVEGVKRVKVLAEFSEEGIKLAEVEELPKKEVKDEKDDTEIEALSRSVLDQFKKLIQLEGTVSFMIIETLQKGYISPEDTSNILSWAIKLDLSEKFVLLETLNVKKRLEFLSEKLVKEMNIAQAEQRIQHEIEKEVGQVQKEFILRERLKAIEKELGIFEEQKEYETLEKKLMQAGLPKDQKTKIVGELHRLKQMPPVSAEAPYIRTYLEWISELPWNKRSEAIVDLKKAKEILDKDHYGLEKTKERVLEYLAVQKLTGGKGRGTILCFVGPPGTGKTSVGQSIARAVGRKFVRMSFGGIRDEAEIRGHRRTYVGALPGRIIQGIRNAGTKNPVFMIDEIDKLGMDFRGDPSAALLEALDSAQNSFFSDHYIEIPFDLSEVFFITTANILDPIPPALRDRMEVIEFPGYTEDEKFHIGKNYLFPRVLEAHGLNQKQLKVADDAIHKVIIRYTREAGVRELERKLAEMARKIAKQVAEGEIKKNVEITSSNLSDYLGPEEYEITMREEKDEVGVSTGLAWTPAGGEIIFIEAALTPGKGNLTLTGQLGTVMQESVRAALTYLREKSEELHFDPNFYYKSDIHVHVPSGAIAKDGPSAGTAIFAALASLLTKRKAKKDVALTGEITLSGKVLPVGGIKEKVLAAHRSGVKKIILPQQNQKNLGDIPNEVRKELDIKFIKRADEALRIALE
ncbi:MAG: endopeptidase La [Candidatus Roizmanbacteria bacterium]|nr:MAG: endopeptidase La [Candidatus Roizmanbacteria bacterium]